MTWGHSWAWRTLEMFGEGFLQGFPRPYALPRPHLLLFPPSSMQTQTDSFPGRSPGAQPHMQMRTLIVWGRPPDTHTMPPSDLPHTWPAQ